MGMFIQLSSLSAEFSDKERKCGTQMQEILNLNDQLQKLTAEHRLITAAKEDLGQAVSNVRYLRYIILDSHQNTRCHSIFDWHSMV